GAKAESSKAADHVDKSDYRFQQSGHETSGQDRAQSPIKSCANCTDGGLNRTNPSCASSPSSSRSVDWIESRCTAPLSFSPSRWPSVRSSKSRPRCLLLWPVHRSQMRSITSVTPTHSEVEKRCATSVFNTQSRTTRLRRIGCNSSRTSNGRSAGTDFTQSRISCSLGFSKSTIRAELIPASTSIECADSTDCGWHVTIAFQPTNPCSLTARNNSTARWRASPSSRSRPSTMSAQPWPPELAINSGILKPRSKALASSAWLVFESCPALNQIVRLKPPPDLTSCDTIADLPLPDSPTTTTASCLSISDSRRFLSSARASWIPAPTSTRTPRMFSAETVCRLFQAGLKSG